MMSILECKRYSILCENTVYQNTRNESYYYKCFFYYYL